MNHNIPKYRKIWSDLSLFKFCPIQSISSREFFSQHISISTGPSVSRPWCCYCTSAQKALKLLKPKKTARAGSSFGEWSPCADVSPAWDTLGSPGIPRADTQAFPQSLVSQAHGPAGFCHHRQSRRAPHRRLPLHTTASCQAFSCLNKLP